MVWIQYKGGESMLGEVGKTIVYLTHEAVVPNRKFAVVDTHINGNDHQENSPEDSLMSGASTPTCTVIHTGEICVGKQGLSYFAGISAESARARGICTHLVTIPPRGQAKAHLHANHETAIYVLSGESEMWYGEDLQQHLVARAGDFLYPSRYASPSY
jgi:uncharacterized RmlC-like cupin family protein